MLMLEGAQVSSGLFKPCGSVATVLAFGLLVFDKWAWSFSWLHPWFVDRPYLKGTWKGVLVSTYGDPKTQQVVPPIEVYLVVRQTYSAIHMRLITKESSSESLANNIPCGEDGVYQVASVYRNTPQLAHRGRVAPDLAEVLLEPQLYRQQEGGNSDWLHADRLAQAKLLFLASLREYDGVSDAAGLAAVFGSAAVSVGLFDRWFVARRLEVEQELELLVGRLRGPGLAVEPSGRPVVDQWLSAVRAPDAAPGTSPAEAVE